MSSEKAQKVGLCSTSPQVRSSVAGCSARGLCRVSVSGRRRATRTSVPAPNTVTASSAARQPQPAESSAPMGGLRQATMPSPVSARDMARAPASGAYRSRTMARAQTTTAPMAAPCSVRHTTSAAMEGAAALPTEARVYRPRPTSSTGRRPKRSDSGPQTSCDTPKASSSALSVNCAWATGAFRLRVRAGRAGRYRSVVTGWMESSRARTTTARAGEMGVRGGSVEPAGEKAAMVLSVTEPGAPRPRRGGRTPSR